MENWKKEILNYETEFIDEKRKILNGFVPKTLSYDFHKKMPKGAELRVLGKKHFHLSYWETAYYNKTITKFLKDLKKEDSIVADIGCGDGRFVELLISMGFNKIIAADIDLTTLISLAEYLEQTGNSDKVLLINTGVESLPVRDNKCDAALSIGVLYYLNEKYEIGLNEIGRILKKGGILVNSEPDKEGALYKSIFFENLDDVYENFYNNTFKEEKGKTPFKFRLFEEKELKEILNKNGFKCKDKRGLSLFPSVVRIMMVRNQIDINKLSETENKMRDVMDYLNENGKLNKHIIWKSVKI